MSVVFSPGDTGVTVNCTTSSGGTPVQMDLGGRVARVANISSVEAFVSFGTSQTADAISLVSLSIPGNTVQYVALATDATHVAGITAATTTTLRVTRGEVIR